MAKADPVGTIADCSARRSATRSSAWMLVAPLLVGAIYFGTRPLLRALARRRVSQPGGGKRPRRRCPGPANRRAEYPSRSGSALTARAGAGGAVRRARALVEARRRPRARRVQVARSAADGRGLQGRAARRPSSPPRPATTARRSPGRASALGLRAMVYAPAGASLAKLALIDRLGAEIRLIGTDLDFAKDEGKRFAAEAQRPVLRGRRRADPVRGLRRDRRRDPRPDRRSLPRPSSCPSATAR